VTTVSGANCKLIQRPAMPHATGAYGKRSQGDWSEQQAEPMASDAEGNSGQWQCEPNAGRAKDCLVAMAVNWDCLPWPASILPCSEFLSRYVSLELQSKENIVTSGESINCANASQQPHASMVTNAEKKARASMCQSTVCLSYTG
jgi:hypothetical protein